MRWNRAGATCVSGRTMDHLKTLWFLVHSCPTLFLEDMHPIGNASTWTSFQTFQNVTVIGYGPFFPQSPTHPDVVEESPVLLRRFVKTRTIYNNHMWPSNLWSHPRLAKNPVKYDKVILRMGGFQIAQNFLRAIGHLMQGTGKSWKSWLRLVCVFMEQQIQFFPRRNIMQCCVLTL